MEDISSTKDLSIMEHYDREKDLKTFDDSKAGVKGLIDAGVTKVPKLFIRPPEELVEELNICNQINSEVPIIDLGRIHESPERRKEIVGQIQIASEEWGFFQVVNHGIPSSVLEEMIDKIREFHEQDHELKKPFYSRDRTRSVRYESNYDLYHSQTADWRDTITIPVLAPKQLDPVQIPLVCRAATMEYVECVTKLGGDLFELLSEALGLSLNYLKDLDCARARTFVCHYYPACPQPELTLGSSKHTDPTFITILLQDQLGGLQVRHEQQWINVKPINGALVVNIGDYLQIISNDKFKSVTHRVTANLVGPRISVASFFSGSAVPPKLYGPIPELISQDSPALYKDFYATDYIAKFVSGSFDKSGLDYYKL